MMKKRRSSNVKSPQARVRRALRTIGGHPQRGALRETQTVRKMQGTGRHLGRSRKNVVYAMGIRSLGTVTVARRPQRAARQAGAFYV